MLDLPPAARRAAEEMAARDDPFAWLTDDLDQARIVSDADLAWTPERVLTGVMKPLTRERDRVMRARRKAWEAARAAQARLERAAAVVRADPDRLPPKPPPTLRDLRELSAARAALSTAQAAAESAERARDELDGRVEAARAALLPIVRAALDGSSPRWRHREGRVFDEKGRDLVPPCLKSWQVL